MGLVSTERLKRFLVKLNESLPRRVMESQPNMIYTASSDDGINYSVTIPGVTSLFVGLRIYVKFNRISASTNPSLNVNNLGAKNIRQPISVNNSAVSVGSIPTWLTKSCPVILTYNGTVWKTDFVRPSASGLYGTVPLESGGTGATTAEGALTNLGAASKIYLDEKITLLEARIEALENR